MDLIDSIIAKHCLDIGLGSKTVKVIKIKMTKKSNSFIIIFSMYWCNVKQKVYLTNRFYVIVTLVVQKENSEKKDRQKPS